MTDRWELILDHSYAGVPGVIFDQSPGRKSHGTAFHLSSSDFFPDGANPGSGAVAFPPGSAVRVSPDAHWPGAPFRCEIMCRCDVAGGGGRLIDVGGFAFGMYAGLPSFNYVLANEEGAGGTVYNPADPPVMPYNTWVPVGIVYDGLSDVVFTVRGDVVGTFHLGAAQLADFANIVIGNRRQFYDEAWQGQIDDVKFWRFNPHWVDGTFVNRPTDPGIRDCWSQWSKALGGALRADRECADHVREVIAAAVQSVKVRAAALAAADPTWQQAVNDYQRCWARGDFQGVQDALIRVISAMGTKLQLNTDPALLALANDACVQKIKDRLPSLDCDAQFVDLLLGAAKAVGELP